VIRRGKSEPSAPGRYVCRLAVLLVALLGQTGCTGWDEFSWRQMNFDVFRDPKDPLDVIAHSTDGGARRRAILCVKEPLGTGGDQKDQDAVFTVLRYIAASDTQAPCRMAAIETLRKFKDPRTVEALKDAYYRAGSLTPESATVVRMLALHAMGDTGNPAAIETLVRVVREPPTDGPDMDRQQKLNEKAAAARALSKFKEPQAIGALVEVLRTEDDIALRSRAQLSLVEATGKDLPADAQAWSEYLNNSGAGTSVASESSLGDKLLQLTGWKKDE
jgi:HEAT repeat protein